MRLRLIGRGWAVGRKLGQLPAGGLFLMGEQGLGGDVPEYPRTQKSNHRVRMRTYTHNLPSFTRGLVYKVNYMTIA